MTKGKLTIINLAGLKKTLARIEKAAKGKASELAGKKALVIARKGK